MRNILFLTLFKEVLIVYVDNRFFYMDIMTLEENEIKLC